MVNDKLQAINMSSAEQSAHMFSQCCTSRRWIERMVSSRPFKDAAEVAAKADEIWRELDEADFLEAFEGHPKIGDVNSLKAKYASTKELAEGEQSSVNQASLDVIQKLAAGNSAYEEKFGFIFIVCATGKSAEEMLQLLEARLPNERATELINAAEEQRKIFHIRLEKML